MKNNKKILIFGIAGQDGSFLAEEYLKKKDYQIHGVVRRLESQNLKKIKENLILYLGDITDKTFVTNLILKIRPHVIYNLAAQSFVRASFQMPQYTQRTNFEGVVFICSAIEELLRIHGESPKLFQASTSQMFGVKLEGSIMDETSLLDAVSPYARSKQNAHLYCTELRTKKQLFITTGISFNHQSTRRPPNFVTRKVTQFVARYFLLKDKNQIEPLQMGFIDSIRDWGHAKDYVRGFMSVMELQSPDDFVFATGETHSVRDLITQAFELIDVRIQWQGKGLQQVGINAADKKILIKISQAHYRPNQVPYLKGSTNKVFDRIGWKSYYTFKQIVKEMLQHDIQLLKAEAS